MLDAPPIVNVVDDDVSVREALDLLVRSEGWTPKLYSSAQAFLSKPRNAAPSCLVLDINLPDLNGLDLQKRVAADHAFMPVIFITGFGDVPSTVQAMKAGAIEFLIKPFSDEAIIGAICSALDRSRALLEDAAKLQALRATHASLSPREQEVMKLVVAGKLNKQVGGELGISEITVKAHRGRVMQKMKATSLADLVMMAARLHITPSAGD